MKPIRVASAALSVAAGWAAWRSWRSYTTPADVPSGYRPAPLVLDGADAIPLVGFVTRLRKVVTDPVGLVYNSAHNHGAVFTIRIPSRFDLTYLLDRAAYDKVISLPAEHAAMGPVFGNVPTIGFWFPRRQNDHESLQELVLTGKRIMAGFLSPEKVGGLPPLTKSVVNEHLARWPRTVDLARAMYPAIYEISGRFFAGDEFWDRYGYEITPALRAIADGIDIPRATLAVTPWRYAMPEYRGTRRLAGILADAARNMPETPLFQAIRAANVHDDDVAWMAMYVLWNAVTYPGSYGVWTLVDIVRDRGIYDTVMDAPDRLTYLGWCLWETIRLNPISSLVRALQAPLTYDSGEQRYHLPAGTVVGVCPAMLNRDPAVWKQPETYVPERFQQIANPRRALFGAGAFGCVAGEFSRSLIAGVCDEILSNVSLQLTDPVPQRRCRVHLTYPAQPILATLHPMGATDRSLDHIA
ncbi:cytochrome P450 [Nocardia sp. NPDC049220]|uniref:cytochrome P450 n=1 Tax=Nocardia sp. NPDC049220 TaxID=3155273 RepID=UPI00340CC2DF